MKLFVFDFVDAEQFEIVYADTVDQAVTMLKEANEGTEKRDFVLFRQAELLSPCHIGYFGYGHADHAFYIGK